jgi:hypothetical protein
MPEANNLHAFIRGTDTINDAIGTKDDFAQIRPSKFGHHSAAFRKTGQGQGGIKQLVSHPLGGGRVVRRDLSDELLQIA